MRILVVDDYPGAAEMSCMLLRLMGHDSLAATSGHDALEKALQFVPQLVVLDLELPDLSGYEVARELRKQASRRMYIAALTGLGATEDHERLTASGFNVHIVKPTTAKQLARLVDAATDADVAD
jgi:CheY-like chemotaxis protein